MKLAFTTIFVCVILQALVATISETRLLRNEILSSKLIVQIIVIKREMVMKLVKVLCCMLLFCFLALTLHKTQ